MRPLGIIAVLSLALASAHPCDAADDDEKPAPVAAPVPGVASGRVTRPDGKPIGIDGTKYDMVLVGNSTAGQQLSYNPTPDAGGAWRTKLADGVYHGPYGKVILPFDGDVYKYDLYPTADVPDTESAKGVVADFHWRIRGPVKRHEAKPNPANHTHWYGACGRVTWFNAYRLADNAPYKQHVVVERTAFVFTATPKGKLIDGSDGKPLTWTLGYHQLLKTLEPDALHDIPPAVGGWTITGKAVAPDGTERPVLITLVGTKDKPRPAVDVKVVADAKGLPIIGPILQCTFAAP